MRTTNKITVGIIGATGYVGAELFRLLLGHSGIERICTSSMSFEGKDMAEVYRNFYNLKGAGGSGGGAGKYDGVLYAAEEIVSRSDVVFTALPHGIAEKYADRCLKEGKKLIDLSADFRFGEDEETFKKWYKKAWDYPEIHRAAVYGLPEMNREAIKKAAVIGNPGCYVTAATLSLLPALKEGLLLTDPIIVDAESGITGAGRKEDLAYSFCEAGESVSVYGVGNHRHQPEIEGNLRAISGSGVGVIFTPHLLPMSRGIISTSYARFKTPGHSADDIRALYEKTYASEPFVRVLGAGKNPTTRNVRLSNYCDLQVYVVHGGAMLEVVGVLDNMVKGAAGQAVQNMNLMYGFDETEGIDSVPAAF